MVKAISLLSGGLDSILATKLILDQDIPIEALTFYTPFMSSETPVNIAKDACHHFKIKHHVVDLDNSTSYLKIIKNPSFGYGKNLNPCIDCHIFMLKNAKKFILKHKADFLITGDVLGERPMSQRKQILDLIDKETSLSGLILRPLSSKLLKPTIPELKGWVDRERLLDIKGRSRKMQLELAKQFNIEYYLTPSGGCLLTDSQFCKKLKDLIDYEQLTPSNIPLLKIGRHFRLDSFVRIIVGRNRKENERIENLKKDRDVLLRTLDIPGPTTILRGKINLNLIRKAATITAAYTKSKGKVKIEYNIDKNSQSKVMEILPFKREDLKVYKI